MISFIKELHEARLMRTGEDLRYSYSELCSYVYLTVLTLEFVSRLTRGTDLAKKYASQTASYINYSEFRSSATDLYNFIYFVQETPEHVEKLFQSADAKSLRQRTQLPRMELNRWLLKLDDVHNRDIGFLMRLEQALNVSNSDLKDIRRTLSMKFPSDSDLKSIAFRILNIYRSKLPTFDLLPDLESLLSDGKLEYIK